MSLPEQEKGYTVSGPTGTYWWADLVAEETPELVWPYSIAVYDKMRRQESKVIAVLMAMTLPVRRTGWWIDPAGAKSRVVKLVSEDLGLPIAGKKPSPAPRTRDRFSWADHLRLALLAKVHGHSVFEQQYRIVAGQARLRKLAWRPPKTIKEFDVAADGGLKAVVQHPKPGVIEPPRMDVSRLVVYCHEREGGSWLGQSVLRPAYKFWMLKDMGLRTMAQVTDRSGNGVPWYTSSEQPDELWTSDPDAAERREKDELERGKQAAMAYRAGSTAGGAGPYGSKMELLSVGKLPDTLAWIKYCDDLMAEAALANFLNLGGDGSGGSHALGETFEDFFVQSLQTTAQWIQDVATQHIVEDIVDANFGPEEPAPRIVCDEIGSKHPATAQALQLLAQVGLITPDEPTERWIRSARSMPEADPTTRREPKGQQAPAAPSQPEESQ